MAAAAPALGGAGGDPAAAAAAAAPAVKSPLFFIKSTLTTKAPTGKELSFKLRKREDGKVSEEATAAAIQALSNRFVYFDRMSNTESGFSEDFISTAKPETLYTWIIKHLSDGNIVLIAARTRGRQEIGTLHTNLDEFTPPGEVLSAGELKRTAAGIEYNLLSGTFMKSIFTQAKKADVEETRVEQRKTAVAVATDVFNALVSARFPAGSTIVAIKPPDPANPAKKDPAKKDPALLIDPDTLPPTNDANIEFYSRLFTSEGGARRSSRKHKRKVRRTKRASRRTLKRGQ